MIDTFYIGAYWKKRKELLNSVIDPTLQTLKELSEVDEQFLNLYELGMSRKQALEYKISLTPEYIDKLYRQRLKQSDLDQNGYSQIGFRLSVWTGHKNNESSQISFGVGKSSERLSNLCLINVPAEGPAKDRLLQLDKVKIMISLLIENWNPDIVVLNSSELSTALDTTNEIGWVTYIKPMHLKSVPKVSSEIVHESNYHGGDLFYLKTNSSVVYDYSLIDTYQSLKKQLV